MARKFRILTSDDYKTIPSNVILIKEPHGWVFIAQKKTQWYVNSTQDNADGKEDEAKFVKKLVKALKDQLKLV